MPKGVSLHPDVTRARRRAALLGRPCPSRGRPQSPESREASRAHMQRRWAEATDEWRARRNSLGRMDPRLAPTEKATPNDLRWAAGFYEGEGCAGRPAGTENVSAAQKDLWTLARMKALFGGSICRSDGCSEWHASGSRARGFLMSIYGLLSPRRQEQARKVMRVGEFKDGNANS